MTKQKKRILKKQLLNQQHKQQRLNPLSQLQYHQQTTYNIRGNRKADKGYFVSLFLVKTLLTFQYRLFLFAFVLCYNDGETRKDEFIT